MSFSCFYFDGLIKILPIIELKDTSYLEKDSYG